MVTCKEFEELHPIWQAEIRTIIRKRMVGKSHVADIHIDVSDLQDYKYKVQVNKYNTVKGWATIGYFRHDLRKNRWMVSFKPRKRKGEKGSAGKTGSYS
jgi:hypothetical protein